MDKIRSKWVVNYELGADIQVLAGDLELDTLKVRLPNSYERYLATLYFNRRGERLAQRGDDILATWFKRPGYDSAFYRACVCRGYSPFQSQPHAHARRVKRGVIFL